MDKDTEIMEQGSGDAEFDKELEGASSRRGRLRRKAKDSNPELAKAFNDMTPEQQAWGKLVGKLITAKSNEQIEEAFDWMNMWLKENGNGIQLTNTERVTAFFHAIGTLSVDDAHYRILRRMYVKANTNE